MIHLTDEDWETIKGIWAKVRIRGADTLYWEDMKDGKHYVDLVVWSETIEGYKWSECYAVAALPSKSEAKVMVK